MPRIIHFEIAVDDPERAVKFYRTALEWKIQKWGGPIEYWTIETGAQDEPGIDGGIQRRADSPAPTVNYVSVTSIDESMEKVTKAGGKVTSPKTPIPGVGYVCYCEDTEGNVFGLMQGDSSVK